MIARMQTPNKPRSGSCPCLVYTEIRESLLDQPDEGSLLAALATIIPSLIRGVTNLKFPDRKNEFGFAPSPILG